RTISGRRDSAGSEGQDGDRRRRRAAQGQDQQPAAAGPQESGAQPRRRPLHRQRGARRNRAHLHDDQPSGRQPQAAQPDQAHHGPALDHETADRLRNLRQRSGRGPQLFFREGVTAQLDVAPERANPARHARQVMKSQSTPGLLLVSLRPEQWIKNLLVLAGVAFGGRLLEPSALATALAAFAIFCVLSGAVYLFNDIADRDADKNHPLKRERPIASGQLAMNTAVATGAVLGAVGVAAAFAINAQFGLVAATYLAALALYSFALKHVVIVDVLMIAAG